MEIHQRIRYFNWTAKILCSRITMKKHLSVCFGTESVCLLVRGVILVPQCESYWWAVRPLHRRWWSPLPKADPEARTIPRICTQHSNHINKRRTPKGKQTFSNVLTISQKVEKHFHFREREDACEVCPLRVAGLRRLLPRSFCSRQHPVAEAIMWPPATTAFCMDILPVLCQRKNHSDYTPVPKKLLFTSHIRSCCVSATLRRVKDHFPDALQLWGV